MYFAIPELDIEPKAVVVDFKWTSIWMDPVGAERIFPEIATYPECLALAREVGDLSFLGRLTLVMAHIHFFCAVKGFSLGLQTYGSSRERICRRALMLAARSAT